VLCKTKVIYIIFCFIINTMIGKVIDKQNRNIIVEYEGDSCSAKCQDVKVEIGDWVIVESGYVVEVISESEALEMLKRAEEQTEEDEDLI